MKTRRMRTYCRGKDIYSMGFRVQDGSWALIRGVRIYCCNSSSEHEEICLSLTEDGAKKLIKGLEKFLKSIPNDGT